MGGSDANSGAGQIRAFINEPTGRVNGWNIPQAESYGVRLPADYSGEIPEQMEIMDVPAGEYIVFEHGPFNYQDQNCNVEEKIEEAMRNFDYAASGYSLDTTQGRVFYFYHDPERFWKYVRPVKKLKAIKRIDLLGKQINCQMFTARFECYFGVLRSEHLKFKLVSEEVYCLFKCFPCRLATLLAVGEA